MPSPDEAVQERLYREHVREMIKELEAQGFSGSGGMPRLREITEQWQREKAERDRGAADRPT